MARILAISTVILVQIATTAQGADAPKVWAVLVGIDDHDDARIPANRGASADARALRRWLVETAAWDGRQILVMDGSSRPKHEAAANDIGDLRPTRENLDWALKEWLPFRARPGDVVLVYFAGQAIGGNVADVASRDKLIPIDADAAKLDETGWSLADALDRLAARGENPILAWLDTSLAGRGKPVAKLDGRRVASSRLLGELTRWPGTAAWIAADGKMSSEPAKNGKRGAFLNSALSAMGTPEQPINLLGGLFEASRDPRLSGQGFRAAGALGPNLSLWPKMLADAVPPHSELMLQRGHADRVLGLAFSADGGTMVSAGADSTIKVWRTSDRMLLRTLPAHTIGVTALALSPDGSALVSGDGAGQVILWSLDDFRPRRFLGPPPHKRGITKAEFVGADSAFATIDLGGKVVWWKPNGRSLATKTLVERATAMTAGSGRIAAALGTGGAGSEPLVRIFAAGGDPKLDVKGHRSRILPEALAIRGDRVAGGDSMGDVRVWKLSDGAILQRFNAGAAVEAVAFADSTPLVAAGGDAFCLWADDSLARVRIPLGGPCEMLTASADGRSAAALTTGGRIVAWTIVEPGKIVSVEVEAKAGGPRGTSIRFQPQGQSLVAGDQDGGIRSWDWPSGKLASRIKPQRGTIKALAVSRDGRTLAQIDFDRGARLWNVADGHGLKTIPGQWIDAAFAPDGASLALTEKMGGLVLVDPATTARKPATFLRPRNADGQIIASAFGPVAISPDGKTIAVGTREGSIACLWPIGGGESIRTVRDHEQPVSAVDFSSDSVLWVTGSLDGTAKVRRVDVVDPLWTLRAVPLDEDEADPAVTAAKFAPCPRYHRVVTGHRDGRVISWDMSAKDGWKPTVLGRLDGPVASIAVSPDGTRLVVGGWDKTARLWTFEKQVLPVAPPVRLIPQHNERVNAVVFWPDGRLIATASDDTTVRFWKPDGSSLVGTFATSAEDGTWVAYDPEGRFDSAPGGEAQVSFLQRDRVLSLDQFDADSRVYGLASLWYEGKVLDGKSPFSAKLPAGLAIDQPVIGAPGGEVELRVRLGDAAVTDLRLYQNDAPVRDAVDFLATADPAIKTVKVRLGAGENRFVAMAARPEPGSIHGRSNVVSLRGPAEGDIPVGVVHVLALGISKYEKNALRYADSDATELSDFLKKNGFSAGQKPGVMKLLPNEQVRGETVELALREIRDAARPEDTVVIFLAGHTDVRRDDRFVLLLDNFPFAPGALAEGQRGPIQAQGNVDDRKIADSILPYAAIYRMLARMNAKNRLVVIDACQAAAIFDDPAVDRIRRKVDDGAHQARTSYLLAARRGEAAGEAPVLKHGLMTYLILLGMGAPNLEPAPGGAFGNADADRDGIVTTEELRQYLDVNLPELATRVAQAVPRANPRAGNPLPAPPRDAAQARGGTATFPVARVPKGN
jgi:WD40 repeat protein